MIGVVARILATKGDGFDSGPARAGSDVNAASTAEDCAGAAGCLAWAIAVNIASHVRCNTSSSTGALGGEKMAETPRLYWDF